MYYVFYETGNDAFFSGITEAFCSSVLHSIIDVYSKIAASQTGGSIPDLDLIQKEFDTRRKVWTPLSCTLFPAVYCGNQECANDNKIVLTSDQVDKFEVSMTNTNHTFIKEKKYPNDPKVRFNIQRILQNYRFISIQGVEQIYIKDRQDHDEYLRLYIKETNKLKDKAKGFVYVRAKTKSDFDYFKAYTGLPNVTVCDNFSHEHSRHTKPDR
jgi:hypothetical protein